MDGRCEAYGTGGLMRLPTRGRMSWQNDSTLYLETGACAQTRLLHFGGMPPAGERSLQGYSVASWEMAGARGGFPFGFPGAPPRGGGPGGAPRFGSLKVVTTNLVPGWLRRNGVPYSADTIVAEHFDRFGSPNGDQWFAVTTVVNDPKYLLQEFVTSSHFKKEGDGSKWSPSTCKTS